jgi:nuclease S1
MRFRATAAAVSSLVLLFPNPQAWSWGTEGHAIVADIAWDHLTEKTRLNLRPFLGDGTLRSVSTWADDIRGARPETSPWHYVNIPPSSGGYDPAKNCPEDNCVVAQINRSAKILGDPAQPFTERSEALKFLVHFVGDATMPFHAYGDARGGNDIPVSVFGSAQCGDRNCNLHGVWDSQLIDHSGLKDHRYSHQLEDMIDSRHLQPGSTDPAVWANESLELARKALVPPHTNIDENYYQRERPVVDQQLALAGLRLARLLNEELGH